MALIGVLLAWYLDRTRLNKEWDLRARFTPSSDVIHSLEEFLVADGYAFKWSEDPSTGISFEIRNKAKGHALSCRRYPPIVWGCGP